MQAPLITPFYHQDTQTYSYLLVQGDEAAIVDPVMDFNPASGVADFHSADGILAALPEKCRVRWILETHVHADHLSAAAYLKEKTGAQVVIGAEVAKVQNHFAPLFHLPAGDLSGFDHLVNEGDVLPLGASQIKVIATPGHTPACVSYVLDGIHVFVGDTFFMPDVGTARTDFPGGDARILYHSLQKLLSLPAGSHFYMCHDYPPNNRQPAYLCTPEAQRNGNIHLAGRDLSAFVAVREGRDKQLAVPRLIIPSLQVNLRGGELPAAENGVICLLWPVNQFGNK
ncbi:MAG: MBL fold metallo-hydrolase [Oceanospirillaceae bacterium]|nr:MBL fold metallo-hydrolase [Oceanospirillaceae bacterium]MCP5335303.1 MBL fold metallo-hydrolase [Oceanospirillaceae bacterium]MCP5350744.1 MBL fold metallo-hydrolase [Oceanospirillaceae bacterium]